MENSVETADSMKSRGYGLPKRTAFSNFSFDTRDKITLLFLLIFDAFILVEAFLGKFNFSYFPSPVRIEIDYGMFFVYLMLCTTPVIIEIREAIRWKFIK